MSKNLYIVRGTGFNIDGSIVEIVEGSRNDEGYVNVSPFGKSIITAVKSIMIQEKYLQRIDSAQASFTYRIIITKKNESSESEEIYSASETICEAIRDINIYDLAKKIAKDLTPILRLQD